jgi:hypothetical protein
LNDTILSLAYSVNMIDSVGNRLEIKKEPLKWLKPKDEKPPEKKRKIWIEDF